METILSGGAQPIVIGHDKGHGHGGCHSNCVESCVREHSLHTDASLERFSLKTIGELCDVRKELSEVKCDLSVKVIEDGQKTRDLIRDNRAADMQDVILTLRAQLIAAGITPIVSK